MNGYEELKIINTEESGGNIFDSLHEEVMQSDLPELEKNRRLSAIFKASTRHVNIMLVGATGSGKSSTVNAMFDMSVAKVGVGIAPETKEIEKYELGNLTIWDTPGLGDNVEEDKRHVNKIVRKLSEIDENGKLLIDLVLVIIDASSKDLAVSYNVINETLIPYLGENDTQRILIAINQADMAMKGRHWDAKKNLPDPTLKGFLTKKVKSVKQRILDATGVEINPVCYSAGYTEDDGEQQSPYNLSKLLYYVLMAIPTEKRIVLADNLNEDEKNWLYNDDDMDYSKAVKESFFRSLLSDIGVGAEQGTFTGERFIGISGTFIGGLVGGVLDGLHGLIIKPIVKSTNGY